jgi:hypothetical protein
MEAIFALISATFNLPMASESGHSPTLYRLWKYLPTTLRWSQQAI